MTKKYQPKKSIVRRESEAPSWKFLLTVVGCGAVLVGGFLFAAKTHFASINYCLQNSDLKKKVADLEAEKRRLLLNREVAMAPAEIRKSARKIGLVDATALNIAAVTAPQPVVSNPLIVKTVDSRPVEKPKAVAANERDRKIEKVEKAPAASFETRERRITKTGK